MKHEKKKISPARHKASQPREAILASALKAFARDGFGGASMPQIANMAKVAAPLVYYYFKSKDELWRQTVDYSMSGILQEATAIRNATRALAPLDRLRALIHAFTVFAAHSRDHVVMIMSEAGSGSERFHWAQENYSNILLKDNLSVLEELKIVGIIKDVPTDRIAFTLFGGILVFFTINQNLPQGNELSKLAHEYAEMVFSLFIEGLSATCSP